MEDLLFGIAKINNKEYIFRYENGILCINFRNDYHEYMFQNAKELPWDFIDGELDITGKRIRFLIFKIGYGPNFFSCNSFSISILVNSYFISNKIKAFGKKTKITLSNNKFSKWLSLFQKFNPRERSINEDKLDIYSFVDLSTTKMIGEFLYKGIKVEVVPDVFRNSSIDYVNFTSELCFTVFDDIGIDFITDFIVDLKSLIAFAFYRQNVEFGNIKVFKEDDNKKYQEVGLFYMPGLFEKEMETPKINNLIDIGFIPWNIFYGKIGKIMEAINNNELYIYHLPENKKLQKCISIESIPKDASAFEFEFYKLYPNYVSSKTESSAYQEYCKKIIEIKNTSNKEIGEICDTYLSNIFKPSLKERVDYALGEFEYLLKDIFEKVLGN